MSREPLRSFGPLVVLAEVENKAELDDWARMQIIRVESDGTLVLVNKTEVEVKKHQKPPIGYVNPFNYENMAGKNKSRAANLRWACVICSKVAGDKEDLIEHYEGHKREKDEMIRKEEVAADDSDYAPIEVESPLGKHSRGQQIPNLDTKNKTICSECGKMVRTRYYDRHMKSHRFKCTLCCDSFSTSELLAAHTDLHQDNTYPCDICGISFKDLLTYAFHNQKHSGLGIFKCPICPFETTNRMSLKIHIKVHNNEFKCICEICGRGFMSFAAHGDHMKLHEGEKRFKCEYCEKTFNLQRYLNVHLKLNHKDILLGRDEWFVCYVCARKFKFETSLARHLSCIHNVGESRRVTCPVCAKVIANNYNLKVHMRVHNGERPYVCKICQAGYARYKYLKKHMASKHKN